MKSKVFSLILACAIGAASALAADITKNIKTGHFTEIDISAVNMKLTYGEGNGSAIITGPEKSVGMIKVENRGDKLVIYRDHLSNKNKRNGKVDCTITLTAKPEEISASLASKIEADKLEAAKLELSAETAASITVGKVTASELDIEAETAASINITKASSKNTDISSETAASVSIAGGSIGVADLEAETSGNITVKADITRGKAEAETAGRITCPTSGVTVKQSTGGSVKPL